MTETVKRNPEFNNSPEALVNLLLQNAENGQSFTVDEIRRYLVTTNNIPSTSRSAIEAHISYARRQVQDPDLRIESIWKGSDKYSFYRVPPKLDAMGGSIITGDYDINARLPQFVALDSEGKEYAKINGVDAELLTIFTVNKNRLITTDEIISIMYGDIPPSKIEKFRNIVRVRISDLRNKIERNKPRNIEFRRDSVSEISTNGQYVILSTKGMNEGTPMPGYIWANLDESSEKANYPAFEGFDSKTFVINNSEGKPVFLLEAEQRLLTILLMTRDKALNFDEISAQIGHLNSDLKLPQQPEKVWKRLRQKLEPGVSEENSVFKLKIEPKGKGKTYRRRFAGGD